MSRCRHSISFVLLAAMLASVASAAPPAQTGQILASYWRELPGTRVADLTAAEPFPRFPNEQVYLTTLEIPENQEGDFGTLIRGFVHPPQDGDYTFYIASTNQSELWLSRDDRPENKSMVARVPNWCGPRDWTASPEQQSKPIPLTHGTLYYIEVRHKNGGGDNHLSVAWKLPDGTMEGPIPGSRLSPDRPVAVPEPRVTSGRTD